jgi:twitching motility protein PilT
MKIDTLLEAFENSPHEEIILEPNAPPYFITSRGKENVLDSILTAATISMLVFPVIPPQEKLRLPNQPEISFELMHDIGKFQIIVAKSPVGFKVSITKLSLFSQTTSKQADNVDFSQTIPNASFLREQTNQQNFDAPTTSSDIYSPPVPTPPKTITNPHETGARPTTHFKSEDIFQHSSPEIVSRPTTVFNTESLLKNTPSVEPTPVSEVYSEYSSPSPSVIPVQPEPVPETPVKTPFTPQTFAEPEQTAYVESEKSAYVEPEIKTPMQSFSVEPTPVVSTPYNFESSSTRLTEERVNIYDKPAYTAPEPVQTPVSESSSAPLTSSPKIEVSEPIISGDYPEFRSKMNIMFRKMAEMKASDLHLSVSMPPMIRKDGKIMTMNQTDEPLTAETMRKLLLSIMPQKNREEFEARHDTDFAYEIMDLARFRANVFMDRKGMGGVFRIIPNNILTAEQLGLSQAILSLCSLSKGLVVITGPTGSGKSTTLCAMIDYVNRNRDDHIITIEDPIEFVHENKKCLINQREVHNHTDSFKDALRAALREDPDILLVGEMRDLETIAIAIETAETGHLVFGTLHTTTAPSTVDRIIDQFPADRQQQIRVMLSESLKGVIAQTLIPKKGGGRVAALEVLIVTPAISNLIREGKTFQIPSAMQTGKAQGMVMLNDALMDLVAKGLVEPRDAYIKAVDKTGFEAALKRNGLSI